MVGAWGWSWLWRVGDFANVAMKIPSSSGTAAGGSLQRFGWRTAWAGVLAVVATLGWGCHREPEAKSVPTLAAATVRTAPVQENRHPMIEEIMGSVRSRTRAVMESKVSGRIERMHAVPGRMVKAGDLLLEIDVPEIRAKVEQARAVELQADRDYDRVAGLFRQEAVTRSELENAESRRGVARAGVVEAQAMLKYARILAPFEGVVTRKLADVGDLAVPGKPLLELEDPRDLRFEADVPATLAEWVKPEQQLPVRLGTSGEWVTGTVSEIEPSADPVSRTFRVRLDLPATADARGGWFGRMALPLAERPILLVPTNAIRAQGQMELAWVVVDGRATLRIVKTGKRMGSELEILSGLTAGDALVVSGQNGLQEGQPVVVP
jgi:RND family efflux transporter MFP subunit